MTRFAPRIHGLDQCSDPPTIKQYEHGYNFCFGMAARHDSASQQFRDWRALADRYLDTAIKLLASRKVRH